jgi:hypothetical protein
MAAAMGWSRFETLRAMVLATTELRDGIYLLLRQGSGQPSGPFRTFDAPGVRVPDVRVPG